VGEKGSQYHVVCAEPLPLHLERSVNFWVEVKRSTPQLGKEKHGKSGRLRDVSLSRDFGSMLDVS
jgi:hypothetical protein